MSRAEIAAATTAPDWPRDPDGAPLYPDRDRLFDARERSVLIDQAVPHTLRIDVAKAKALARDLVWREEGAGPSGETGTISADPAIWGDFIVARRDVPTSYHLSVVVDDALQGVTHVVRGRDLFHATAAHVLLQRLLGVPTPVYRHHRLIADETGRKLAKSARDTSLAALREAGATPADIRRSVGL
jgi:glutamyl-Q tRNA(Asp) synthetase